MASNWDTTPWFVEGGAEHSPQIARLLSYAAFSGSEGIIGSKDLEVRAQSGVNVQVYPGACAILNRAAGAKYEAYIGRLPIADTVAIAPTGATSGRSDMIVAIVKNPWLPGEPWPEPSDVTVGPYIETAVISGVPSTATTLAAAGQPGYSAIPLARIDIPVNTSVITQAMIKDLRFVSRTRSSRDFIGVVGGNVDTLTATLNQPQGFPAVASFTTAIPDWATHLSAIAQVSGMTASGSVQVTGKTHVYVNVAGQTPLSTPDVDWATDNTAGNERLAFACAGNMVFIPAALRGKQATVALITTRVSGGSGTIIRFGPACMASIDVEFSMRPETNA